MSHMFVPGPVDVAPEVLAAQTKPMIPHRSKDFEAIFKRTEEKAKQLFFTQYRVFSSNELRFRLAGSWNSQLCARVSPFLHQWFVLAALE